VVLISTIVLVISLVEIFLMLRSSFLSRVKEVGTLRAIGLKKGDVYKMFLGEILAILALTAPLGFFIMGYVLKTLTQYEIFAQQYVFDSRVILYSAAIVLVFDVIVGLLPVFFTLRKTPARILARTDVD
jgi:ABC-type antimicrobial peptide transport system permease subunit